MDRLQELIKNIRYVLADPDGDRWPDDFITSLISEAQTDIVLKTKLLRTKYRIYLTENLEYVKLPDDLLLLDKVLYKKEVLPLIPHYQLDQKNSSWEENRGTIEAIVYDKMNRGIIRLYPIPDYITKSIEIEFKESIALIKEDYNFNSVVGEVTDMQDSNITSSQYGIVTNIDFLDTVYSTEGCITFEAFDTEQDVFGVVTDIQSLLYDVEVREDVNLGIVVDGDILLSQVYGITTDIEVDIEDKTDYKNIYGILTDLDIIDEYLDIYYIKKPTTLLEIDDVWDKAIKFYVAGMALRYDADTQNVARGNEYLQMYLAELQEAKKHDFRDFIRTSMTTKYEIQYKGFI
jgi:hypothetical protein